MRKSFAQYTVYNAVLLLACIVLAVVARSLIPILSAAYVLYIYLPELVKEVKRMKVIKKEQDDATNRIREIMDRANEEH